LLGRVRRLNGSGATATFDSTGSPTGPVAIACNVSDDKGQTATAGTTVTIPCVGLSAHRGNVPDTAFFKALAAEETDLDFGLSQQLPCLGM
jgi:hypothetical protein